jgi:hypothetical protein
MTSFADTVVSRVAEGIRLSGVQKFLFMSSRVNDFVLGHPGLSGQDRLLARINLEVSDVVAFAQEVEADGISRFSMV